jgi:aspartyl-tRNA(Asn)/glutamyl-tRNA(Gln) amidotransferase subunit C
MSLDEHTVRHMAKLARLGISESQIGQYQKEMAQILEFVDQLQSIDTSSVEPLAHPIEIRPNYRPDVVIEPEQRDHLQSVAPEIESGLYLVPRVVE